MTKNNPKSSNPLGPVHSGSLNRANKVPDAAKGFPNTNPGYSRTPLIYKPVSAVPKEPKK